MHENEVTHRELVYGDADADPQRFDFADAHGSRRNDDDYAAPLPLTNAQKLAAMGELRMPGYISDAEGFIVDLRKKRPEWGVSDIRFSGRLATGGQHPETFIDGVFLISNGEFPREGLKSYIEDNEFHDFGASYVGFVEIAGSEAIRAYWD